MPLLTFLLLLPLILLGFFPAGVIYYHFRRFALFPNSEFEKKLKMFQFGTIIFSLISLIFLILATK